MVLDLLITIPVGGFILMLCALHVIRALYAVGICEPPEFPSDLHVSAPYLVEPGQNRRDAKTLLGN